MGRQKEPRWPIERGIAFTFRLGFRPQGNESIKTLAGTSGGSSEAISDVAVQFHVADHPGTDRHYADRMLSFPITALPSP
jgi:hypothetical protein